MSSYIPEAVRLRVRAAAEDRCGYCRSHQRYVLGPLEIEHILPVSRGGSDEEDNLWLGCARCNRFKGAQIDAMDPLTETVNALFNPRVQRWGEHFRWEAGGAVIGGLTPSGRATVVAVRLNYEHSVAVRRNWIAAGWHPPEA